MTRFLDGPAAGTTYELLRVPKFLRVHATGGRWTVLDMLDDEPAGGGKLWCYYRVTTGGRLEPDGQVRVTTAYVVYQPQPPEANMRGNQLWRNWCLREANVA